MNGESRGVLDGEAGARLAALERALRRAVELLEAHRVEDALSLLRRAVAAQGGRSAVALGTGPVSDGELDRALEDAAPEVEHMLHADDVAQAAIRQAERELASDDPLAAAELASHEAIELAPDDAIELASDEAIELASDDALAAAELVSDDALELADEEALGAAALAADAAELEADDDDGRGPAPDAPGAPFATATMAGLLERQGDRVGATRIRASLQTRPPAPAAPPVAERRRRVLQTLEGWLGNLRSRPRDGRGASL